MINSRIKAGREAVIGAGAVVTKDVHTYAIMVGVPERILKFRDIKTKNSNEKNSH